MSELYFVRHGQAAFGTENYDRLTEVGLQQSRWLGEYFAERRLRFDRIVTGGLARHRETWNAMAGSGELGAGAEVDPRLDEYAHQALHEAYAGDSPEPPWDEEDDPQRRFYGRLERALHAWAAGRLDPVVGETWNAFSARVGAAVATACVGRGRCVLVISSGGPMAVTLRKVLELPSAQAIELNMQIRNSAFSHFYFDDQRMKLASFNNIPHLDRPERLHAITLT